MTAAAACAPHVPWSRSDALEIIARICDQPGALMPILTELVRRFGYIDPEIVPEIAESLNLSRAEVHGVISFYHDFRTTPPGRHILRVCRAESCQAVGGRALEEHARERLGVDWHQTTDDGRFTLEPVFCLGNCACSPALMVDETLYGRVTPERFDEITAATEVEP